ncbi:MAG: molybdenum cofactor guanylyltransferase [Polyangiales bacterium]
MTLAGIFVGGAARRMGGAPKGLLPSPDTGEALVVRAARCCAEAGLTPVLVGRAEAYRAALPALAVLDDDPPGCGPLGGLRALLRHAQAGAVVALACDLPHLTADALRALRDAPDDLPVVAPRAGPDAPWEPLLARYDVARATPAVEAALAARRHGLQPLLRELGVRAVELPAACLIDWDAPGDLAAPATRPTPAPRRPSR